eukprot:4014011-Pyramimonas_sp.AAC.1
MADGSPRKGNSSADPHAGPGRRTAMGEPAPPPRIMSSMAGAPPPGPCHPSAPIWRPPWTTGP